MTSQGRGDGRVADPVIAITWQDELSRTRPSKARHFWCMTHAAGDKSYDGRTTRLYSSRDGGGGGITDVGDGDGG